MLTYIGSSLFQLRQYPEIIKRSKHAAVSDIFQLSASELALKEPNLQRNALGGLWIPGESITDPWLLPILLANDAVSKGAKVNNLSLRLKIRRNS